MTTQPQKLYKVWALTYRPPIVGLPGGYEKRIVGYTYDPDKPGDYRSPLGKPYDLTVTE